MRTVELWATLNEPNMYCGYFSSLLLLSGLYQQSDVDTYKCMHNIVLGHAEAYHIFKDAGHKGWVGITALVSTALPNSTGPEDVYVADAVNQGDVGLVLDPVVRGDYPQLAKDLIGSRLHPFSEAEKSRIGTTDFIGFNVYSERIVQYEPDHANPLTEKFKGGVPFHQLKIAGLLTTEQSTETDKTPRAVLIGARDDRGGGGTTGRGPPPSGARRVQPTGR